jgi:hypothetical protein
MSNRHGLRSVGLGFLMILALQVATAATPTTKQVLPSEFRHDLIYLTPLLQDGSKVTFYTDSGGGFNAISNTVVAKQGWPTQELRVEEGETAQLVDFPVFAAKASIPPPVRDEVLQGRLFSVDPNRFGFEPGREGFLGNRWFAGKVLEFDYPGRTLSVLQGWRPSAAQRQHRVPLAFKAPPQLNFPRVRIEVDGEPIEVLFDTGAQFTLSPAAAAEFELAPSTKIAGSFITKTRFDAWAAHHPDWKVIVEGDVLGKAPVPMIRVAELKIAGWNVGPVWFSQRPDANFLEGMSAMMDRQIEGAIGGSAFKYFTIVADYPGKAAYFVRK